MQSYTGNFASQVENTLTSPCKHGLSVNMLWISLWEKLWEKSGKSANPNAGKTYLGTSADTLATET
jgi:hypothetical protein